MRKILQSTIAALTICATFTLTAYAGTWQEHGDNWKYLDNSGTPVTNKWVSDQEQWYYLDDSGFMFYSTTRNIDGTVYTFDASGAWLPSATPLNTLTDGWNGNTYTNHRMNYQITVPDSYTKDASFNQTAIEDDAVMEFIVASYEASGIAGIVFARYDLDEIEQFDLSAMQFALMLNEAMNGNPSDVTTVMLGECEFVKVPYISTSIVTMDVYFRRVGTSITMIETIYEPGREDVLNVLQTIRKAQ